METRTIKQVRIWKLILNDMRSPKIEYTKIAVIGYTAEEVMNYYKSNRCEYWKDGQWGKSFKQGSLLEWFNPEDDVFGHIGELNGWRCGLIDEWVDEDVWNNMQKKCLV